MAPASSAGMRISDLQDKKLGKEARSEEPEVETRSSYVVLHGLPGRDVLSAPRGVILAVLLLVVLVAHKVVVEDCRARSHHGGRSHTDGNGGGAVLKHLGGGSSTREMPSRSISRVGVKGT